MSEPEVVAAEPRRTPMPRTLSIVVHEHGEIACLFTIVDGENVSQPLIWDELLAEIARLTIAPGHRNGRYMQSADLIVRLMEKRSDSRKRRAETLVQPWTCTKCSQLNSGWATHCGRCNEPAIPAKVVTP